MIKDIQPELNIGLVGHVDHGKTTLAERLSGRWTDTHSEELKRGITIRLGYADMDVYECSEKGEKYYSSVEKKGCKLVRKISLIDAPGHETLMATMLSGAAIMDGALLLIAANEECPQPQTKEHLMALEIIGVKNIIIVQNKIDLVDEKEAKKNYEDIKKFVKGTTAEKAPVIPISAQHDINIDSLLDAIESNIKTPKRDYKKDPIMFVARSFDINKPGAKIDELSGGVLGGALKQGILKKGMEVEIKPGIKKGNNYVEIKTKISELRRGGKEVEELRPGGSIGIKTLLDPSIVKSDNFTGNVVGVPEKLPKVWKDLELRPKLLERVVGSKDELIVEPIKKGETLMLNVNAAATIGTVTDISKDKFRISLKIPVCADKKDRITISRQLGHRWRLIGYSEMV